MSMDRRLLVGIAIVAAILMLLGLFALDRPLAEWVRASGTENASAIVWTQYALETVSGQNVSRWLLGAVALLVGIVILIVRRDTSLGRALIVAALVQYATTVIMLIGKDYFGRLRPFQVFTKGDWSILWFTGGVSFPSGHLAFYAGFFVPLAACTRNVWLRVALLAVPLFFAIARIDVAAHFLSDVSTSTLIAALISLLAATLLARFRPLSPRHPSFPPASES